MTKLSDQSAAKARAKGVQARSDGVHPAKNPYKVERNFRAWLEGWTEKDTEITEAELKNTFADPSYAHSLLNPNNLVTGGKWGQFGKN